MRTPAWLRCGAPIVVLAAGCSHPMARPAESAGTACAVALASNGKDDSKADDLRTRIRAGMAAPQQLRREAAAALEQLGFHYIARARSSNDPGDYTLARQAADCLEALQPGHANALLIRGHVLHQQHRFREAERVARQLVAARQFVLDYGLLGDALLERGDLREAASAYQRMVDLKPFYQSYIRAAHLRWLTGDTGGAIGLVRQAIASASPRDPEAIAWAYTRLAYYELHSGRVAAAAAAVDAALTRRADYPAALLARARVRTAQHRTAPALEDLERAARLNPLPEYTWALADGLRSARRIDAARTVEAQLVAGGERSDPRTLALYLATRRQDTARAVRLAERELGERSDVFTLDAYAWALAADGQQQRALDVMQRALVSGTEDGRMFLHAALIAAANGRAADARRWAAKADRTRFTLLPSELEHLRALTHSRAQEN